jgi:hypothetical protein
VSINALDAKNDTQEHCKRNLCDEHQEWRIKDLIENDHDISIRRCAQKQNYPCG